MLSHQHRIKIIEICHKNRQDPGKIKRKPIVGVVAERFHFCWRVMSKSFFQWRAYDDSKYFEKILRVVGKSRKLHSLIS